MNIEIDNDIAQRLNAIAALRKSTVSEILRDYADAQERYWRELDEDMKTLDAMKNGEHITGEDMFRKLDTLISK